MKNGIRLSVMAILAGQFLVSCEETPKAATETVASNTPVVTTAPAPTPSQEPPTAVLTSTATPPAPTTGVVKPVTPAPAHPTGTVSTKGASTPAPAPAQPTETTAASAPAPVQPTTDATSAAAPVGKKTAIRWDNGRDYNWGTATEGDKVTHIFKFTNTGTEPLVILDAKASCGCTVPEKPQAPIAPGKTGEIKVQFDSSKKSGPQAKTVTVTANTDPTTMVLTIKGDIKGAEEKK